MKSKYLLILCAFYFSVSVDSAGQAEARDKFLALGSGYEAGTYYPVGNALCDQINRFNDGNHIRCLNYSTGGSVYNIEALASGELDLAITQSNLAFNAFRGLDGFFSRGANDQLRTVMNLYDQPFTVTVHKESGIADFSHFKGRILNIGNEGSGKRTLGEQMLRFMGVGREFFKEVQEYSTSKQIREFCRGNIDIMIESVGVPTPLYKQVEECGGIFLDLPPDIIAGYKGLGPFFFDYEIPTSMNKNNQRPTKTIGMKIVLISKASVSAETIESITRALLGDPDVFPQLHPALSLSSPDSVTAEAIHVPLHDGVLRFLDSRPADARRGASR
jgi:TRAP transporter TAXI family solute receptor